MSCKCHMNKALSIYNLQLKKLLITETSLSLSPTKYDLSLRLMLIKASWVHHEAEISSNRVILISVYKLLGTNYFTPKKIWLLFLDLQLRLP